MSASSVTLWGTEHARDKLINISGRGNEKTKGSFLKQVIWNFQT